MDVPVHLSPVDAASGDSILLQDSHYKARSTRMTTQSSTNAMMLHGRPILGSSTPGKELDPRENDAILALHEVRNYACIEQAEVFQATAILLDLKASQLPNNTGPYPWETARLSKPWTPFDARHVIRAIRQDKHTGNGCAYSGDKKRELSLSDTITDSEIDSGPEDKIKDDEVKGGNGLSAAGSHGQIVADKEHRAAQSPRRRRSSVEGGKRIKRLSISRSSRSTSKQSLRIATLPGNPVAGMNGEGSSSQPSSKGSIKSIATPSTNFSPNSTYDISSTKSPSLIHREVDGGSVLAVSDEKLNGSSPPSPRRPSGPRKRSDYGKALVEVTELEDTVEVKFEKLAREGAFAMMEGRSMRSRSRRPTLEG